MLRLGGAISSSSLPLAILRTEEKSMAEDSGASGALWALVTIILVLLVVAVLYFGGMFTKKTEVDINVKKPSIILLR